MHFINFDFHGIFKMLMVFDNMFVSVTIIVCYSYISLEYRFVKARTTQEEKKKYFLLSFWPFILHTVPIHWVNVFVRRPTTSTIIIWEHIFLKIVWKMVATADNIGSEKKRQVQLFTSQSIMQQRKMLT